MDSNTFGRYSRQEYKEHLFPDKKEYYKCLDMFLACRDLVRTNVGDLHPKTLELRKLYEREIVDKAWDLPGPREKFGCLLPMKQIKNNAEFQQKFKEHVEFLANIIKGCIVEYNPADKIFTEAEICFVLYTHPELIKHVKQQTDNMQKILLQKGRARLLKNPPDTLVRNVSTDIVKSVPFNQRDIDFDMMALMFGKMSIKDAHFKQIPEYIVKHINSIPSYHIPTLVKEIETLGIPVFGENVMEQMRLLFIKHEDCPYSWSSRAWYYEEPALTYMKNPSKKVKEASVIKNPYTIGAIKYQYDAIQELALRTCKEKHIARRKWEEDAFHDYDEDGNPWNIQVLYSDMIRNPSVKIQRLYNEMSKQY